MSEVLSASLYSYGPDLAQSWVSKVKTLSKGVVAYHSPFKHAASFLSRAVS
jgi:hypothetical protein